MIKKSKWQEKVHKWETLSENKFTASSYIFVQFSKFNSCKNLMET